MNEITINGEIYVKKIQNDELQYVIIRTHSAGCFAGYLESIESDSTVVNLKDARRLWYWDGASSLSQLAMEGVKRPENCKFPCEVSKIRLIGVVEIIHATDIAKNCIKKVPVWAQ